MKDAISLVIKYAIPALLVIALVVVSGGLLKSCKTIDSLSYRLGQEQAKNAALDQAAIAAKAELATALAKIDGFIAQSKKTEKESAEKDKTIAAGNATIQKLKKERDGLADKDAIIKNQDAQIAQLERNITLVTQDRDQWKADAIHFRDIEIPDLKLQCAKAVKQYDDEHKARLNQEQINKDLVSKRNATLFGSTVEKAIIVALGIVVAAKVL